MATNELIWLNVSLFISIRGILFKIFETSVKLNNKSVYLLNSMPIMPHRILDKVTKSAPFPSLPNKF